MKMKMKINLRSPHFQSFPLRTFLPYNCGIVRKLHGNLQFDSVLFGVVASLDVLVSADDAVIETIPGGGGGRGGGGGGGGGGVEGGIGDSSFVE